MPTVIYRGPADEVEVEDLTIPRDVETEVSERVAKTLQAAKAVDVEVISKAKAEKPKPSENNDAEEA